MKRFLLLCVMMLLTLSVVAQNTQKVAILEIVDKAQNISYGVKLLLRGTITTAISSTPGYEGFDRVDMASIAGEHEFQRTGNVSDSQIKELGIATGAAYVLVAEAAKYDESNLIITAKILDVETYGIKSSAVEVTGIGPKDMQKSCSILAKQLLSPVTIDAASTSSNSNQSADKPTQGRLDRIVSSFSKSNESDKPKKQKQQQEQQYQQPQQPIQQQQSVQQPVSQQVVYTVMPVGNVSSELDPNPLTTLADGTLVYLAMYDENEKLTYDEAVAASHRKGEGWRLPTTEELKIIEKHKNQYHNLNKSYRYWAIEGDVTIDMSTGFKVTTKKSVKAKVRCVKEIKQ